MTNQNWVDREKEKLLSEEKQINSEFHQEINHDNDDELQNILNDFRKEQKQKRKKIISVSIILFVILSVASGFYFIYANQLLFFKPEGNLELVNDMTAIIRMSQIENFDAMDFVEYYDKNEYDLVIPDKEEIDDVGDYTLEYVIINKETKEKVKSYLNIQVIDDIIPELELSETNVTIEHGGKINLKEYIKKASDNVDGNDLKDKVNIIGSVDNTKAGKYEIKFNLKDSSNNEITKFLNVTVKEKPKEPEKDTQENSNNNNSSSNNSSSSNNGSSNNSQNSGSSSSNSSSNSSGSSVEDSYEVKKRELNGKTFLFKDGYDMSNVMSACASELSKARVAGTCEVLYENGVIIGAKIVVK